MKRKREKQVLPDVQKRRDGRRVPLDEVGVQDLVYSIVVYDRENERQHTIANISMAVNLPHHFRGTHMSRFVEVLNRHRSGETTMRTLPGLLADLKRTFSAKSAQVEIAFPYLVERAAPVSGARATVDYRCTFFGRMDGELSDFTLRVYVPVMSVCPCSLEISDFGAHSQRGVVTIDVKTRRGVDAVPEIVWIEELVEVAEAAASAPVRSLLKREDEKHITERAFNHPVFVEDIVRNIARALQKDARVTWYRVKATNQESIHNHSAYARTSWTRQAHI